MSPRKAHRRDRQRAKKPMNRRQIVDEEEPHPYEDCPLWRTSLAFRDRARNLLNLGRALLERCDGELQTLIAVLVLFEAESRRKGSLVSALRQAFREIIDHLLNLPVLDTAPRVFCCDARNADRIIDTPCDLLVTSPPYINVFNYHQNHRAIVELLGFDVLGFARSEIGSNRKHRGNRFKTVVQYALDMERCLYVFNRLLKDRGVAVVVVGRESRVRGVPFKNGDIIMQLASAGDLLHIESLHERKYTNRFGTTIFEDILILRKQARVRLFCVGGPEGSRRGCERHGKSYLTRRRRGEEGDGGGSLTGGAIPSA